MATKSKPQAQAAPSTTVDKSQISALIQAHRQQLANLRLQKGEAMEQLEQLEAAEKRTEGAIFGLESLLVPPQNQAPSTPPETTPEPSPEPKAQAKEKPKGGIDPLPESVAAPSEAGVNGKG